MSPPSCWLELINLTCRLPQVSLILVLPGSGYSGHSTNCYFARQVSLYSVDSNTCNICEGTFCSHHHVLCMPGFWCLAILHVFPAPITPCSVCINIVWPRPQIQTCFCMEHFQNLHGRCACTVCLGSTSGGGTLHLIHTGFFVFFCCCCLFKDGFLSCHGCSKTYFIEKAGLKLTEIHLRLPPKC